MYRTFVILRHTFFEAIGQPIFTLLIIAGTVLLTIFAALPMFTLGDDTTMFKAVGLDIVLVLSLIATLFATSKSIFEEIEDRTMLSLMSKPVGRGQVLLGKYLGLILSALLVVGVLGFVLVIATYLRVPGDYQLNVNSIDELERARISNARWMHLAGLFPSLALLWLQICTLAAVSVAISTRVSLVVNLPVVILLYFAGNLTRFLSVAVEDRGVLVKWLASIFSLVLPFLEVFDLRERTVYSEIKIGAINANAGPAVATLTELWSYVAIATLYGAAYVFVALVAGVMLFRQRELGGAEG